MLRLPADIQLEGGAGFTPAELEAENRSNDPTRRRLRSRRATIHKVEEGAQGGTRVPPCLMGKPLERAVRGFLGALGGQQSGLPARQVAVVPEHEPDHQLDARVRTS